MTSIIQLVFIFANSFIGYWPIVKHRKIQESWPKLLLWILFAEKCIADKTCTSFWTVILCPSYGEKVNITYQRFLRYLSVSNPISPYVLSKSRKVRNLAVTQNQGEKNTTVRPIWRTKWKEYEGGGGEFLHISFMNGEKFCVTDLGSIGNDPKVHH